MKIEKQVCSFELAQKLAGLGVKIDTFWMWWDEQGMEPEVRVRLPLISKYADSYPAPTVAELGTLLPSQFPTEKLDYEIICQKTIRDYYLIEIVSQQTIGFRKDTLADFSSLSEADARAEALIWLIENNYVKAEDLKL